MYKIGNNTLGVLWRVMRSRKNICIDFDNKGIVKKNKFLKGRRIYKIQGI